MSFWENSAFCSTVQHIHVPTPPSGWVDLAQGFMAALYPTLLAIALTLGCLMVAVWKGR